MGKFAFQLPSPLPPDWEAALAGAWLANAYDHRPLPAESTRSTSRLSFVRQDKDSASLGLFLPTPHGARAVATSTLRPDAGDYRLVPELVRGALARIRNVTSAFTAAGLPLPPDLDAAVRRLSADFSRLVTTSASAEQDALGMKAIPLAIRLTDLVGDHLAGIRLDARCRSQGPIPLRFGSVVREPLGPNETAAYRDAFNAVQVATRWDAIEPREAEYVWDGLDAAVDWAASNDLAVTVGPLIDFSGPALPQWMRNGPADVPSLAALMTEYVGAVVDRYRGRVRSRQLFSGLNAGDAFPLDDEERLRLASRLLEFARAVDPQGSWTYALQQPYGEYLRDDRHGYSPVDFADTLLRNGHGDAGIALAVETSRPHGCVDFWRLLDGFEALNCKLEVAVGGFPDQADAALELSLVRAAMSARSVGAITWRNWSERQTGTEAFPSVLYDLRADAPTPLLRELRTLRERLSA